MKKNLNDMSPDMRNFGGSPTTSLEVSFDGTNIQNELIKIDLENQTVSARALYDFLELSERFSKWFKRMVSYGLVENVDFTAVSFCVSYTSKQTEDFTTSPSVEGVLFGTPSVKGVLSGTPSVKGVLLGTPSVQQDIGDFLLTIDAAKQIAMVQRSEKGKKARTYFINIEKLYHQQVASQKKESVSLRENLKAIVGNLEKKYQLLLARQEVLEKEYDKKNTLLKQNIILFTQKVDVALKSLVAGVNASGEANPIEAPLSIQNYGKRTVEEELILKYYAPATRYMENAIFLPTTDITLRLKQFNKKITLRNVGMALKKLEYERVYGTIDEKTTRGYFVIQLA